MGLLVIVLGSALSAIGAMAIWFGWEIVLNERGWTQVISGSVGLSGGIVTIALGLVLIRLGGLRRDLKHVLAERQTAGPAREKVVERLPAPEPPPPPGRKRRKDIGTGQRTPLPQDIASEPVAEPAASVTAAFAPTLAASGALTGVAEAGLASSEDPTVATLAASIAPAEPPMGDPARAAVEASRGRVSDETPAPEPRMPSTETQVDETHESKTLASPERSDRFSYDRFEAELARLDEVESAIAYTSEAEPALPEGSAAKGAKPEPAAPPQPAADSTPKSAIVGQYEAGGVSYVMYADGSIEADTAGGVYRFVDINELKAFIQNQGSR